MILNLSLPHPALVDRRAGVAFHPLAQLGDQLVVDHELPIVVRDLVRRQRFEALGRRHVGAGRERADAALLLLGKEPGEVEFRRVGMRRVLEDAAGQREHWRLIDRREHHLQLALAHERPH